MHENLDVAQQRSRVCVHQIRLALLAAVFLSSACTTTHPAGTLTDRAVAPLFNPAIVAFCSRMQWSVTCTVPDYTDDQRFLVADDSVGPHAFIAPAPNLIEHVNEIPFQGTSARLVGFVRIDASEIGPLGLPATYSALRLNPNFTCVYLHYSPAGFSAYMVRAGVSACNPSVSPADPAIAALKLEVKAASLTGAFTNPSDIPPVARFHEGRVQALEGIPLIGLRCGNKWCMILPTTAGADTVDLPHKSGDNARTSIVHGWHDVQRVSRFDAVTNRPKRTAHRASIVPHRNLAGYPDFAQKRHSANVVFQEDPTDKYESDWRFRKGRNEVWLQKLSPTEWRGEVRSKRTWMGIPYWRDVTPVHVKQVHKHPNIPKTARFLWVDTDEDLWIGCEDGCCEVRSGSIS